ncbi:ABC-type multidrug transport system ATPase subunit [Oxalobacteraceae bacterium GrIS 1.11]
MNPGLHPRMVPARRRDAHPDVDRELRQLIAQFMALAAAGDCAAAGDILARLFAFRGRFHSLPSLRAIADGKRKIERKGPLYTFAGSHLPPAALRDFADAIAACADFLALPAPTILLEYKPEREGLHLTIDNFPGFAVIQLSGGQYGEHLRAEIFHETGHAFLTCGVRLLDEGLACLIAEQFSGVALEADGAPPSFSLRTLLSPAANDGLFFEGVGASFEQADGLRRIGARIIARLHQRHGGAGVAELFHALAQAGNDGEIAAMLEQRLGQRLEDFHCVAPQPQADHDFLHAAGVAILRACHRQAPEQLDATIAALEARAQSPAALDLLIGARLHRAALQLNTGQDVGDADLARIDILMVEGALLPEARRWTLRGHRAVLALRLAGNNIAKLAIYGEKAATAYERALRLTPDDPDLRIGRAQLYINTPMQYGGDRARGLGMLRDLIHDTLYGQRAIDLLRYLGQAVASDDAPLPARKARVIGAEAAITVNGLRLAVSDQFTLCVDNLMVHRNERVALVGRNGSGKTVLLETLMGLRQPHAGSMQLRFGGAGQAGAMERKRRMGGLLQDVGLFGAMYVRELVRMHRVVYGCGDEQLTGALGIDELLAAQYRTLSRGQMQRVHLFLALAHHPDIVLLDEPSLGLDEWFAQALRKLWDQREMSLVVISHLAADIERMDRVICLDGGRIVDQGKLADLVKKYVGENKVRIFEPLSAPALAQLRQLPGIVSGPQDQQCLTYGSQQFAAQFKSFAQRQGLNAFSIEHTGTEDFLAKLTGA